MGNCAEGMDTKITTRIAEKVGSLKYNVWFRNATQLTLTGDFLRVSGPNHYVVEWIERHFGDVIGEAAREITGKEYTLCFAIDPTLSRNMAKKQSDRQVEYIAHHAERAVRSPRRNGDGFGVRRLKGMLADFVRGESNELAFTAACHVVEHPGNEYNPLFIHGGCGLGKTHLLHGICNGLTERHAELRWVYVTGEEFTNAYVQAIRSREQTPFHNRYRNIDVLVIDDVHFLANKRATQEEFLHTFNAIDAAGKQIVLASDAHPKMIGHFSDSLVSRFVSGMVVRIEAPDLAVRIGVLRQRARRLKIEISDAVIEYIAENFRANIRELEGALLTVVAQAQVTGRPITLSLAERAIRSLVRQTAPVVMLSDIESVVAIYFGLKPADLHTSRKSRTIALARGIAMYLARKHTDMSFPEIGRFLGNKNHSTVILATRRISKKLQGNEVARWMTPAGQKETNLAELVTELETQCCLRGHPSG